MRTLILAVVLAILAFVSAGLRAKTPRPTTTRAPTCNPFPDCATACNNGNYNVLTNPTTGCKYCNCLTSGPTTNSPPITTTTRAPSPTGPQTAPCGTCATLPLNCDPLCPYGYNVPTDSCGCKWCNCATQAPPATVAPAPTTTLSPTGPSNPSCTNPCAPLPLNCDLACNFRTYTVLTDSCGCKYCHCNQ